MTATTPAPTGASAAARPLPPQLLLGVATAAYQIEGATHRDGRADSIWDAFSRIPGAVVGGESGERACEHYDRYRDDVALMRELGVQVYRFSTSWARVQPDGRTANPAGLDFYRRLTDELLAAGITPWLTLYHWDLPQALQEVGGWPERDTALRFADYAADVHAALGDRIHHWTTLNEPWCSAFLGYLSGEHAPGEQNPQRALDAAHHLLLGHGLATQRLRSLDASLDLGITLNMTVADPVDPHDPADLDAARRIDAQHNRLFLDPIFRGAYPADLLDDLAARGLHLPVQEGDLAAIATPIDALGVNYYHGDAVSAHPPAAAPLSSAAPSERPKRSPFPAGDGIFTHPRGLPVTAMGWEVQPEGLTRLLRRIDAEYTRPAGVVLYVTENGAAYTDVPDAEGFVDDIERAEFVRLHVDAVVDAIEAGVDVRGYFYWSLLDNFEWAWGYDKRFGLVRVDYDSQSRTVKRSGRLYQAMIAGRSVAPPLDPRP
ncbi:GH1 family beta-glucosidase [Microcella frigidaquae]|uniref:Beta-glucosidase n=1 Tax=Microcella frigidaquae TaxID=424758 RepID=A0A840XM12_9MICO|nr:GH1 family beta-glucosidase [Microcella frigidaquae]MBB5617877.1 beta-glucosidase [Microcella frigidaquae]NHN44409.1 beta-glucosidase [Microcella frigidaquae]